MSDISALVADNLEIWTGAVTWKRTAGGGGTKRISHYGIERLRALILDLAVRGKLVPQQADDMPVGQLLTQIASGRLKLIQDGLIKAKKAQAIPAAAIGPFEIPASWVWIRLDQLGAIIGGGTPTASDATNFTEPGHGIPWLTPADLTGFTDKYIGGGQRDLTEKGFGKCAARMMPSGAILFTSRAPIGYVAVAAKPVSTSQGFKSVVPSIDGISEFIALTLAAFAREIDANAPGTIFKEVSGTIVGAIQVPLPPLAEQSRIVAKVDELMALCDALEAESAAASAAHQRLVDALLAALVESADPAEIATTWTLLESHFDTLFATEASIEALKQAILDLAVRGRLVKQCKQDEPAEGLFTAAKQAVGVAKEAKSHPAVTESDHPFRLPASWCWQRFDSLIQPDAPIVYGVPVPGDHQPGGVPFVRVADLSITDPPPVPEKAISPAVDAQCKRTRIKGGEILMGIVGSIGKLGVAPDSWAGANVARAICRIEPASFMDRRYVLWLLQSRFMQDYFKSATRNLGQPTLNLTPIRLAATPVPPFAEQRRIAAKVDELMALCDALRTRIIDAEEMQRQVADAVTERAAA